jgi:hypothetical protein
LERCMFTSGVCQDRRERCFIEEIIYSKYILQYMK